MIIHAVDPGPKQSGYVQFHSDVQSIVWAKVMPNEDLLAFLWRQQTSTNSVLVLEQIAAMGMAVGAEVFETCFWSGRFVEAWDGEWDRLTRVQIKTALCGTPRAKDPNVRQALIDRFGGKAAIQRAKKATKTTPAVPAGPLAGVSSHCWAALAVALVWRDRRAYAQRVKAKEEHATVQF